jgi:hypothetical protein
MHKYFSISSFYQTVIAFITMGDGYITLLLHGVSSEVRKKSSSESYWLIMQDSCFRNCCHWIESPATHLHIFHNTSILHMTQPKCHNLKI